MRFHPGPVAASLLGISLLLCLPAFPAAADDGTPTPSPAPTPGVQVTQAPIPPADPSALGMATPGANRAVARGGWINTTSINLQFHVAVAGATVVPEIEIEAAGVPFRNQPTASGAAITQSGVAGVTVQKLVAGRSYHWQARVTDSHGQSSNWVPFGAAGTPDFGVDLSSPVRPLISSPTDPNPNRWYNSRVVRLQFQSHDTLSGIAGYSFLVERVPRVIPPGAIVTQSAVALPHLPDGQWFVAVRSVDRAGNWSPTATFRLQLDRRPPQLSWIGQQKFTFNPYKGPATVRFSLNKAVSATFLLYRVGNSTPVARYTFKHLAAGQVASITWTGKDAHGNPLPRGYYFFSARATDHANNSTAWHVGGITLTPERPQPVAAGQVLYPDSGKQIIVSLSRQVLYAYDGTRLVLQTYVTTGNPNLPTPLGHYTVLAKYHPYEFISPWPPGSPYYYPPSTSNYAMLFRNGGYFLHDAPWRGAFGPGTNGAGQPGTNYGGTHGCVNIPPSPMYTLFQWAPIGTPVSVVP